MILLLLLVSVAQGFGKGSTEQFWLRVSQGVSVSWCWGWSTWGLLGIPFSLCMYSQDFSMWSLCIGQLELPHSMVSSRQSCCLPGSSGLQSRCPQPLFRSVLVSLLLHPIGYNQVISPPQMKGESVKVIFYEQHVGCDHLWKIHSSIDLKNE